MPTLLEIAKRLGELTSLKAPKKTGNLRKRLREVNTGRNILGGLNSAGAEKQIIEDLKSGTFTFTFEIDVAPQGAEYGEWWNTPPNISSDRRKKLSRRPEFNFFDQAYNSAEFQQLLNNYTDTLGDKIANSIAKTIDRELK